jgi:hypothetical protein
MARLRLLFLLLMIPTLAMADSHALVAQTWKWYQSNFVRVQQVLRSSQDPNVVPYVHAIGTLYQFREGSIGAEVAPALATALTHNPAAMLSWFQAHPVVLEQWLNRLQSDLLTDYQGTQSAELLRIQKELAIAMHKVEADSPDVGLRRLASRTRKAVEAAKVISIR